MNPPAGAALEPMDSFNAVAALESRRLRGLLSADDSRVRVWAAWALGLRLGRKQESELTAVSWREPEPGARRYLLVALACCRDLELLRVLAQDDPDRYVRAAACLHLGAVSEASDPALQRMLLALARTDPVPEVRAAALQALKEPPLEHSAILMQAAADEDPEVRAAAFDALSRFPLVSLPEPLRREVIVRLRNDQREEVRQRVMGTWSQPGGAAALLAQAERSPADAEELLGFLAERRVKFDWERLVPLVSRRRPELNVYLAWLVGTYTPATRKWLLGIAANGALGDVMRPLLEALRSVPTPALDPSESRDARRVKEELGESLESGDLDDLHPSHTWKHLYLELRKRL